MVDQVLKTLPLLYKGGSPHGGPSPAAKFFRKFRLRFRSTHSCFVLDFSRKRSSRSGTEWDSVSQTLNLRLFDAFEKSSLWCDPGCTGNYDDHMCKSVRSCVFSFCAWVQLSSKRRTSNLEETSEEIWLILPVVICLFQGLSHANVRVLAFLRREVCVRLIKRFIVYPTEKCFGLFRWDNDFETNR